MTTSTAMKRYIVLCVALQLLGCASSNREMRPIGNEAAKWSRGRSTNEHYYVLSDEYRKRMIGYIRSTKPGTSLASVVEAMGTPDADYERGDKGPFAKVRGRTLYYYLVIHDENLVFSKIDQIIYVHFGSDFVTFESVDFQNVAELGGSSIPLPSGT